ncbi:MAG: hypothetical protein IJ176_09075, partial [Prevotella sp.]|nr:hypothetical protein [Prevotella sp.]
YKCATKVIILIITTKHFPNYFQLMAKKIGQPRQATRNFGGMIADNHINYTYLTKTREIYGKKTNNAFDGALPHSGRSVSPN